MPTLTDYLKKKLLSAVRTPKALAELETILESGGGESPVTQDITNGDTTHAPSGNAIFDALANLAVEKANITLNNLETTSVNSHLLPDTSYVQNLGSPTNRWNELRGFFADFTGDGPSLTLTHSPDDNQYLSVYVGSNDGVDTTANIAIDGSGTGMVIRNSGGETIELATTGRIVTTGQSVRIAKQAADPVTDIEAGDMYYNTVSNKMMFYNGATWETITSL